MQLASQCLCHLNRAACLGRRQSHQGLGAIRQTVPALLRNSRRSFATSKHSLRAPNLDPRASSLPRCSPTSLHSVVNARDLSSTTTNTDSPPKPSDSLRLESRPGILQPRTIRGRLIQQEPDSGTNIDPEGGIWLSDKSDVELGGIPENEDDPSLWLSVLVAAKQKQGRGGVLAVWEAVKRRRSWRDVTSEEAKSLWGIILENVLHDEDRLKDVALFAERLLHDNSAQWPSLYLTTVSYCLRKGQYRRVLQWHMRLMPNFDPGQEAFGALLREFAATSDPDMQQILQALYLTAIHRGLYNEIIPLLYERGLSQQCAGWRHAFIYHDDLPPPNIESQPYLRFLARYYPTITLELEEQVVIGLNSKAYWDAQDDSLWDAIHDTHGDESGPPGRQHSDKLGARWFASSWVPLDFAIHAVHALGVHHIGPLSLQSIALREPTAKGVLARIEQLRAVNIGIGHSAYAWVLKRFAENNEDELLAELLHTDIHPDVFDDPAMLASIRDKAFDEGDWKTHRLLLSVQPAMVEDSVDSTSNVLLHHLVDEGRFKQALALLDEMRTMDIGVHASTIQHICASLLDPLPWNPKTTTSNQEAFSTAIAFLTRLTLLQKPLHSRYWQKVLFGLGKFGRFDVLEDISLGILDTHRHLCISNAGLLPVHPLDAPPLCVESSTRNVFVPTDLPISHEQHPMRRIFDNPALHAAIARWGFKAGGLRCLDPAGDFPANKEAPGGGFSLARGVRLLAALNDRGIPFRTSVVQEEVVKCLARTYLAQANGAPRVQARLPPLNSIRELFNKAARRRLLPDVAELQDLMMEARGKQRRGQ
ncbi:pentatricopeptide repeat domain-containing protein [Colletotrichum melonis]|uniref:Pentatricopeptide repeat domain-containing protein n=1 Tax=Colletotrichum melonis TaxID=1209925 RepID=A0AAI9Y038_9PEZI|nr:pentatricopeptide repeat domain-containing protein [Colletotrichum melonis]